MTMAVMQRPAVLVGFNTGNFRFFKENVSALRPGMDIFAAYTLLAAS